MKKNPSSATPYPSGQRLAPVNNKPPVHAPTTGHSKAYSPVQNLQTSGDQLFAEQKNITKQMRSDALDRMAKADYQPASFSRALQYRNERSYMVKRENQYVRIEVNIGIAGFALEHRLVKIFRTRNILLHLVIPSFLLPIFCNDHNPSHNNIHQLQRHRTI